MNFEVHAGKCLERRASALPSCDLDGRFLVGAEEGHVRDTNEGPSFAGPELNDGALLRDLGGSIEVSKAHTAQVGGKADEDVPVEGDV